MQRSFEHLRCLSGAHSLQAAQSSRDLGTCVAFEYASTAEALQIWTCEVQATSCNLSNGYEACMDLSVEDFHTQERLVVLRHCIEQARTGSVKKDFMTFM